MHGLFKIGDKTVEVPTVGPTLFENSGSPRDQCVYKVNLYKCRHEWKGVHVWAELGLNQTDTGVGLELLNTEKSMSERSQVCHTCLGDKWGGVGEEGDTSEPRGDPFTVGVLRGRLTRCGKGDREGGV